ncbi:MAG: hypothetical protein AABX48_04835 [Nanoarchaeota archaeon]
MTEQRLPDLRLIKDRTDLDKLVFGDVVEIFNRMQLPYARNQFVVFSGIENNKYKLLENSSGVILEQLIPFNSMRIRSDGSLLILESNEIEAREYKPNDTDYKNKKDLLERASLWD